MDAIAALARKHGLDDLLPQLVDSVLPAVQLTKLGSGVTAGAVESRFGGIPDVPPGFIWPQWQNRPLGFLAQIRCDEVSSFSMATDTSRSIFPSEGLLSFFYDSLEQPWGFDPADRGGAIVVYTPDHAKSLPATLPDDVDPKQSVLPPYRMGFNLVSTVPAIGSAALDRFELVSCV